VLGRLTDSFVLADTMAIYEDANDASLVLHSHWEHNYQTPGVIL
jgi:hypothetical protein